jgi:protein-S-isoprenylcysteine O-methyltransferase Ste14
MAAAQERPGDQGDTRRFLARLMPLAIILQKSLDVLALLALVLLFPIPFFWLLIHPAIHFWRRFGNRSFGVALPVWAGWGAMLLLLRGYLFEARFQRNAWTWVLGASLLAAAIWIDRRTRHDFGLRRLAGVPEINPGHQLSGVVRTGAYAFTRHPRYTGYMLTLLSMACLTGALRIFLLAIVSILLYQIVARLEERELLEHYGRAYEAYARAVPRFLPRWRRKIQPQVLP